MRQKTKAPVNGVSIETGAVDWQVLQQDENGVATMTLSGRWQTLVKRRQPEVRVRVVREGCYSAISSQHDWQRARMTVDSSVKGAAAGTCGAWTLEVEDLPCGGPYRVETSIGSSEDAVEWRRSGDVIHFLCVGDIWLIAGQSNASGTAQSPIDDPSEIGVHVYEPRGGWKLAAHGSRHSPWLAFAKTLKKERGYPIGLIPTAVGGSCIAEWDPGSKGALFDNMKQGLTETGANVKGVVWYQGESDTGEQEIPHYKTRFKRFLKGLRDCVGQPQLPIITVQLNRLLSGKNGPGWEAIREIQRQLSHELENTFVIAAFESVLCDGIHNGCLGNLLIAQRAADTALGGIYCKPIAFRHPECVAVELVSDKELDLYFENVVVRLDYIGNPGDRFPFAIRDRNGEVPVAEYGLPQKNVFRISLERPPAGPVSVTGAPGSCPPHIMPRDINGYRSMLGFTMAVDSE